MPPPTLIGDTTILPALNHSSANNRRFGLAKALKHPHCLRLAGVTQRRAFDGRENMFQVVMAVRMSSPFARMRMRVLVDAKLGRGDAGLDDAIDRDVPAFDRQAA
jgi:hypothetical protein